MAKRAREVKSARIRKRDTTEEAQSAPQGRPHVVIIGAGFGGISAAKELGKLPVEVTIIDRNNYHLFQPMLYEVATANLSPADIAIPIRSILAKQPNTGVLMAEVTGIDTGEQQVVMNDRQSIHYDYLVIAMGATSNYFGHQQWQQYAPGIKSLNDAITVRRVVLSAFEAAEREPDEQKRKALLTFVLVGGGPTGVELAGAIAELAHQSLQGNFRHINPGMTRIVLVEGESRVMPSFPASLTRKVQKKLEDLGVELKLGVHVKQVSSGSVEISNEHLETDNVIWTAGVKASPAGKWLHAGVDHDGRVKVQRDLTVPDHTNIFVIGDTALALQNGKKLPGLAPVAIQQGKYVASVIAERAAGKTDQRPFRYFNKGTLATVGRSFGVVDIGPLRFTGFFAWLTWLIVHILFLIGFRNRVVVAFQYGWSNITAQQGARVILPGNAASQPD